MLPACLAAWCLRTRLRLIPTALHPSPPPPSSRRARSGPVLLGVCGKGHGRPRRGALRAQRRSLHGRLLCDLRPAAAARRQGRFPPQPPLHVAAGAGPEAGVKGGGRCGARGGGVARRGAVRRGIASHAGMAWRCGGAGLPCSLCPVVHCCVGLHAVACAHARLSACPAALVGHCHCTPSHPPVSLSRCTRSTPPPPPPPLLPPSPDQPAAYAALMCPATCCCLPGGLLMSLAQTGVAPGLPPPPSSPPHPGQFYR